MSDQHDEHQRGLLRWITFSLALPVVYILILPACAWVVKTIDLTGWPTR